MLKLGKVVESAVGENGLKVQKLKELVPKDALRPINFVELEGNIIRGSVDENVIKKESKREIRDCKRIFI